MNGKRQTYRPPNGKKPNRNMVEKRAEDELGQIASACPAPAISRSALRIRAPAIPELEDGAIR